MSQHALPQRGSDASKAEIDMIDDKRAQTPPTKSFVDEDDAPVHWRTWMVVLAASLQYTGFALILTSSGFWASAIIASVGGADKRLWISSVWIPVSAALSAPMARFGDLMGRRYIWILANLIGVLGNWLVAGANSVGMVILGVALWGVCFGNAGNVLASAEVIPRRHRGTANMLYQIGGYLGTTIALLAGARLITDSNNWRPLFWLTGAVHLMVAILLGIFYLPPKIQSTLSAGQRLMQIDWIGCTLFAAGLFCILLSLTWGGQLYAWDSAPSVAPIVVGFALLIALGVHQYFFKKDGLFHRALFQNRNMAICGFGIFTEGFAYIIFNSYYGVQVGTLWDASTFGLALRFGAFVWTAAVASAVYIYIAYRWRAIKELLIWGFFMFTLGIILFLAAAGVDASKTSIVFVVITSIGVSSPLSFLFAAAQLSVPPAFAGQAMGILVALRQAGGSIGPAAAQAVYADKIAAKLPGAIAGAAVAAGLPASSLTTFVPALAAGNATLAATAPGANPAILAAAGAAALQAYAESFRYVWAVVLPFAVLSLIAVAFLKPFKSEMTQVVDRPIESELTYRTHDVEHR